MQDMIYWLWLSLSVSVGTDTFKKLISHFETPKNIYLADDAELSACIGSRHRDFDALIDKSTERAEEIYDFCTSKGVGILTYSDPQFPQALKNISNPPVLLYYRGVLPNFNSECFISVVGTRRLTAYGRKNAFSISADLAKAGAVVVSGMAIGIDGVALAGALGAGGTTVAIIGSGIDVCYPEHHKRLAREIVKRGCVMTEYPPKTLPHGSNFPRRNRLISGISAATVVIEGKEGSGALITARCAKEQGRQVYALPGNVDNKTSEVTNSLIKNNAKLITDAYDIIKDAELKYPGKINIFKAGEEINLDMDAIFKELQIACVTPGDDIFSSKKSSSRKEKSTSTVKKKKAHEPEPKKAEPEAKSEEKASPDMSLIDKASLKIYKKIPEGESCSIESLADEEHSVRDVMRALMKLEMGRFIVMLPGEKVKRNL